MRMVMEIGQLEGGSQVKGGVRLGGVSHLHQRKIRGCDDSKRTKHGKRVKRRDQVTKGITQNILVVQDKKNAHKNSLTYSPDRKG